MAETDRRLGEMPEDDGAQQKNNNNHHQHAGRWLIITGLVRNSRADVGSKRVITGVVRVGDWVMGSLGGHMFRVPVE